MKITLKLFANLGRHLPAGARQNAVELDVSEGATIAAVLHGAGVPREGVRLVFVDGVYQFPHDMDRLILQSGQTLAVWPPVAGG